MLQPKLRKEDPPCGDTIFFRNGEKKTAKVTYISDDKLEYKHCDDLKGPGFIRNLADIYRIRYSNGVTEDFGFFQEEQKIYDKYDKNGKKKKIHPIALTILILTILFPVLFPFGAIATYILKPIGKRKIRENPSKYRGMEMIETCVKITNILLLIIGGIIAAALLLILILLLILLAVL
jgi:hypothetical protein